MMQGIIDLHHDIFFFLILILVFVSRILVRALWHFHYQKNPIPQRIVHGTTIEILRTIFPSIIPMFIAIPSFALLYSMDEVVVDPAITIKAIGHQWYRTYEYSDYNSSDEQSLTFDSYTIPEDDLELGQSRLLEVDNRVVVPAKTHLRIIVTPADVPHSWAVPSLGVKCDAVPGRLNQISISVQREGVYYGQCSEICGTNHAFTPIVVEAVPSKDYGSRVSNQLIPQTTVPHSWAVPSPNNNLIFGLLPLAECAGKADAEGPLSLPIAREAPPGAPVPGISPSSSFFNNASGEFPAAEPGEEVEQPVQQLAEAPFDWAKYQHDKIAERLSVLTPNRARDADTVDAIIYLKRDILARMAELNPNPFWAEQKNELIANGILNKGAEYTIETLQKKLEKLKQDGIYSDVFKDLSKLPRNEQQRLL
nr:cytochrome c oxidase subunit 2 [Stylosanthes guianensis]